MGLLQVSPINSMSGTNNSGNLGLTPGGGLEAGIALQQLVQKQQHRQQLSFNPLPPPLLQATSYGGDSLNILRPTVQRVNNQPTRYFHPPQTQAKEQTTPKNSLWENYGNAQQQQRQDTDHNNNPIPRAEFPRYFPSSTFEYCLLITSLFLTRTSVGGIEGSARNSPVQSAEPRHEKSADVTATGQDDQIARLLRSSLHAVSGGESTAVNLPGGTNDPTTSGVSLERAAR